MESGEILSSSSKLKLGLDELFVTCLNSNEENKIGKPIKNHLDLFINSSLNHMSIRSRVVSQPNNKLNSNSKQLFKAIDLSPITFVVILPPKLRGKISKYFLINPANLDENENSKVRTIKILLDSGASPSIVRKDVLHKRPQIL